MLGRNSARSKTGPANTDTPHAANSTIRIRSNLVPAPNAAATWYGIICQPCAASKTSKGTTISEAITPERCSATTGAITIAAALLQNDTLDVDVEYEAGWISQFPVTTVEATATELIFTLGARHTACLAEDQCKRPPQGLAAFHPQAIQFKPLANLP